MEVGDVTGETLGWVMQSRPYRIYCCCRYTGFVGVVELSVHTDPLTASSAQMLTSLTRKTHLPPVWFCDTAVLTLKTCRNIIVESVTL